MADLEPPTCGPEFSSYPQGTLTAQAWSTPDSNPGRGLLSKVGVTATRQPAQKLNPAH